jgi:hypothetical protein
VDGLTAGVIAGIIAGIAGGILGPLAIVLLMPQKKCPDCAAPLTRLRNCWDTPRVMRRCRACGCGVDVKGQKVGAARRSRP